MVNNLNQLTNIQSAGPIRFAGCINETGLVKVASLSASMTTLTNFAASVNTSLGTNVVDVVAWDSANNYTTNRYQVVITNGVATTLKYDANGNLTNQYTSTYTNYYDWDAEDRPVRITRRSTADPIEYKHEFIYDGLGRRVQIIERTNGVVATARRYLWCGTEICERRNSGGATIERQYFAHGEWQNPGKYHYTRDHLGSIRDVVGGFQALQARYDYDPYGRKTTLTENTDIAFAYTGHFSHSGSGLHLAMFRALDSATGRWLSRDPLGEAAGLNLYQYASSEPINRIDPFGLAYEYSQGAQILGLFPAPSGYAPYVFGETAFEQAIASINNVGNLAINALGHTLNNLDILRQLAEDTIGARGLLDSLAPFAAEAAFVKAINKAAKADCIYLSKFPRVPSNLLEQFALQEAMKGKGELIIKALNDPRFLGMEKWEYVLKTKYESHAVVHYVRNPKTGELMDFKFAR